MFCVAAICLVAWQSFESLNQMGHKHHRPHQHQQPDADVPEICLQPSPWVHTPDSDFELPVRDGKYMANVLSQAVQIDTTVMDEWGPLSSNSSEAIKKNYADAFLPFESWLEKAFPAVHQKLKKEVVDSHGLLFTWQGSEPELKPLMLMAHQDVVPVEPSTVSSWKHDPFSGFIDEENQLVWGRGSSDDKAGLIGVMTALEALAAKDDFKPKRSIIASFGFDEESAGSAADALAAFLEERYGKFGIEMIVDEGGQVIGEDTSEEGGGVGLTYAAPATSEKGYMDVRLVVNTPGGHSSEPPPRTGIGYLSRLVAALEDEPPLPTLDSVDHPALAQLLCLRHAPAIKKRKDLSKALAKVAALSKAQLANKKVCPRARRAAFDGVLAALQPAELNVFKTTQAVDLIQGGVKINALPERSVATINYRVDVNTPSTELQKSLGALVAKKAKDLGLDFDGWKDPQEAASSSKILSQKSKGSVHLELTYAALEAAPKTPVVGPDASAWRLLSSVIRGTYLEGSEEPILVIPSIMNGNTDTKSTWNLTRNIFRFSPGSIKSNPISEDGGIHTINENAQIDGLVKGFEFYVNLMVRVQG